MGAAAVCVSRKGPHRPAELGNQLLPLRLRPPQATALARCNEAAWKDSMARFHSSPEKRRACRPRAVSLISSLDASPCSRRAGETAPCRNERANETAWTTTPPSGTPTLTYARTPCITNGDWCTSDRTRPSDHHAASWATFPGTQPAASHLSAGQLRRPDAALRSRERALIDEESRGPRSRTPRVTELSQQASAERDLRGARRACWCVCPASTNSQRAGVRLVILAKGLSRSIFPGWLAGILCGAALPTESCCQ